VDTKRVVVLGSTGSIGTRCLEVIEALRPRLSAVGLSAHRNWDRLCQQANRFCPQWIAITDSELAARIDRTALCSSVEFLFGTDGVERMVTAPETDLVLAGIVGAAGLRGAWAAVEAGKTLAIANKETLVIAGPLIMDLARRHGAAVLPVDSEHSAIFQALQAGRRADVRRVILTASGGPFRTRSAAELSEVTIEEALRHPTWQMGPKITIDSATMMNKALEVIEAKWLFGLEPDQIQVVIHPESLVHSMVEFADGSVLAQLSPPDMRLPIQYALTYPERVSGPATRLEWDQSRALHFEPPDPERFPALKLGEEVARRGGTCGAVLNAANEAAVHRFLSGEICFSDIPRTCRAALEHHDYDPSPSLEGLLAADRWARTEVAHWKR